MLSIINNRITGSISESLAGISIFNRDFTFAGFLAVLSIVTIALLFFHLKKKNRELRVLSCASTEALERKDLKINSLTKEKESLLHELHHRVKNNLQIMTSLLNLQANHPLGTQAADVLKKSRSRIFAIALAHQKIYTETNLLDVDIPVYIQDIIKHLKDEYDIGTEIIFSVDLAVLHLAVDLAVPLGLIINEAVTNAINFAFPERKGVVKIQLAELMPGRYSLEVADNGIGIPEASLKATETAGKALMKGLSQQLHADFTIMNDAGVHVRLDFSILP